MAEVIYKLWLARPTDVWHQLSQDEQNKLLAKSQEALAHVGGKELVACFSGWASEQWPAWGVEEFPDLAALQNHTQLLSKLNWSQYFNSKTLLGTTFQMP